MGNRNSNQNQTTVLFFTPPLVMLVVMLSSKGVFEIILIPHSNNCLQEHADLRFPLDYTAAYCPRAAPVLHVSDLTLPFCACTLPTSRGDESVVDNMLSNKSTKRNFFTGDEITALTDKNCHQTVSRLPRRQFSDTPGCKKKCTSSLSCDFKEISKNVLLNRETC